MKKYAIISFLVIPLLLSGCSVQRKSTTATPTPEASATAGADTNSANQTDTTVSDTSIAIETQYQTNFTTATTDANQILQNKAKFCSVMVKFSGSTVNATGDQLFFFSSDELLTDYYWLVEFDGLNLNKKKRYFAARRDFKDEITCVSTPTPTPPSYVDALNNYLTKNKIPDTTTNLQIALQDTLWNVIARDTTGQTTSTGQIAPTTSTIEVIPSTTSITPNTPKSTL